VIRLNEAASAKNQSLLGRRIQNLEVSVR
jgi:hypothetical protein